MSEELKTNSKDEKEVEIEVPTTISSDENHKFRILEEEVISHMTNEKLVSYIKSLHDHIKKQSKKLKKIKEKLKKKKKAESRSSSPPINNTEEFKHSAVDSNPISFIDEIKQAAEVAQNQTDFVFEPESGLFYDRKSGFYYDAERALYYDGDKGCYYTYNQEDNKFEFHSQVYTEAQMNKQRGDSHSVNSVIRDFTRLDIDKLHTNALDIAKKYPPSMRIIVTETNVPKLKIGELFLITYKGGTLGREGDHDVIIPDINVSKYHLKFAYDEGTNLYNCIDLGSRNGTVLNGSRMCSSQQESDLFNIPHGSVIELSQTKLLCHIHDGHSTCGQCEPGLIVASDTVERQPVLTHREGLKQLQKRYGLENEKYIEPKSPNTSKDYSDRAAIRRVKVGSFNGSEKTETASLETAIPKQNKGFKMLSKLGWSEGQKLGKNESGLLEPIETKTTDGKRGLGCSSFATPFDRNAERKKSVWKKAQDRYNSVPKVDIFNENDDY